ncbi:uncharacterized protein MONBRDRAFT_3133, partial [Monosiga brevicollis MX1]
YHCADCQERVSAEKLVRLRQLPACVIISLKRMAYDMESQQRIKIHQRCEFPLDLDLRPYMSDAAISAAELYRLTGVVVHSGSAQSGHYYAFAQQRDSSQWLRLDDRQVTPVSTDVLLEQSYGGVKRVDADASVSSYLNANEMKAYSAYLLVYERVEP